MQKSYTKFFKIKRAPYKTRWLRSLGATLHYSNYKESKIYHVSADEAYGLSEHFPVVVTYHVSQHRAHLGA